MDLIGREANAAWTSATRCGMGNCGIIRLVDAHFHISWDSTRAFTEWRRRSRSLPRGFEIGSLPLACAITVEITGDSISRWMAATRGVAVYFLVCSAFTCLRNPLRSKRRYLSSRGNERAILYPLIKALIETSPVAAAFDIFFDKYLSQIISWTFHSANSFWLLTI